MELINNVHIQQITNILKESNELVEGNLICDVKPDNFMINYNIDKIKNIQYLCRNKKKIIEIGINACHSLVIMLLENPNAEYLLFDLNNHKYTEKTLEYVKKSFPNTKINVVFGNSVETIKKYIIENENELNTYDLCHLDGGHTENIFSCDYEYMKKMIKYGGIIIFDDSDMKEIFNFLINKIKFNEIREYYDYNLFRNNRHFIYQYI